MEGNAIIASNPLKEIMDHKLDGNGEKA